MVTLIAAADSWKSWLDDVPLPETFNSAAGGLQDFITALSRALLDARAENARLRADAQAADEGGMDAAADKILDWLAKAVGAKEYTSCEGSETWDGDVQGTIYAILKAGNVYDDEDGRVAKLADAQAAVALVVEHLAKEAITRGYLRDEEIRTLAPADGLAAVEALRKERDAALAANRGLVRLNERTEAERDRLAAANAALEAKVARLVGALEDLTVSLNYLQTQAKNGTLHPQVVIQNVDAALSAAGEATT